MRHQQHQTGKEKKAEDAELDIRAAFEKPVPSAEMFAQGHDRREETRQYQDGPADEHAGLAVSHGPFGVFGAAFKTAAQTYTT